MFNKARLNFLVDAMILIAFLAVTVSGLLVLTLPQGGTVAGEILFSRRQCSF